MGTLSTLATVVRPVDQASTGTALLMEELVLIAVLLLALGIGWRYLTNLGISVEWLSIPRIARRVVRLLCTLTSKTTGVLKSCIRLFRRRRRVRRRWARTSIGPVAGGDQGR